LKEATKATKNLTDFNAEELAMCKAWFPLATQAKAQAQAQVQAQTQRP